MIRIFSLIGLLALPLFATDKIQTVIVTIPVLHTHDEGGVKWAKIPHTGWDLDNPHYACFLYSSPQVMFKNEHFEQDINLISAYQLTIDTNLHEGVTEFIIRTDKAKKPEGHRMTVDEVLALAVKGIRQDYPDEKKFVIKASDQPFEPKKKD